MEKSNKPFSQEYVLKTTAKHMKKSVEISIKKTMDRMSEFHDNHEKANEVFKTLTILQAIKKQVEEIGTNKE